MQSIFLYVVIALSCVVFVLFVVIGGMGWKLRRARTKFVNDTGQPDPSSDRHVLTSMTCLELHPMSSEGQSPASTDLQVLQFENKASAHYNMGFEKEIEESEQDDD